MKCVGVSNIKIIYYDFKKKSCKLFNILQMNLYVKQILYSVKCFSQKSLESVWFIQSVVLELGYESGLFFIVMEYRLSFDKYMVFFFRFFLIKFFKVLCFSIFKLVIFQFSVVIVDLLCKYYDDDDDDVYELMLLKRRVLWVFD